MTAAFAHAEEAHRDRAVRSLVAAAVVAGRVQAPLFAAVRSMGGRTVQSDALGDAVTATLPRRALTALAARSDVQAISPAAATRSLSLPGPGEYANSLGARAWWAGGYSGGHGSADANLVNLAVIQDGIDQTHPAFAGSELENPPGWSPTANPSLTYRHSLAVGGRLAGCVGPVRSVRRPTHRQRASRRASARCWTPSRSRIRRRGRLACPTRHRRPRASYVTVPGAPDPAHVWNYSRGASNVSTDDTIGAQCGMARRRLRHRHRGRGRERRAPAERERPGDSVQCSGGWGLLLRG